MLLDTAAESLTTTSIGGLVSVPIDWLASMLKKLGVGGPRSMYGAIGSNGARKMLEDESVSIDFKQLELASDKVTNVEASTVIDSHNGVWNKDIANLLIQLVETSPSSGSD
jgi:hypothetical protein